MPRLHYVANVRLPSERANAYQILAQCDAFRAQGCDVSIVAPDRVNRFALGDDAIAAYYGLRRRPSIVRLPTIDWIDRVPARLQRLPFVLQSVTFAFAARRHLRRERATLVYSRDAWSLALLARSQDSPALVYECHDLPRPGRPRARLLAALRRCAGVVAITAGLKDDLVAAGLDAGCVAVFADGFDPSRFAAAPSREAARKALRIAPDARLAVYTGHLFPWKGADALVAAAASSRRFDLLLVGGRPEDRARIAAGIRSSGAQNVRLDEPVAPAQVATYLAAADVVAIPNSAKVPISARYTSPLKLFEAMAMGKTIVASDLPSLREVLAHERNALLVAPDDAAALAAGIERALDDRPLAARLAAAAREDSGRFTWDARARGILAFVESRPGLASR